MKLRTHLLFLLLIPAVMNSLHAQIQTPGDAEVKAPVVTELSITTQEIGQFGTIYQLIGTSESCKVTSFHILRVPADVAQASIMEFISPGQFNEQVQKLVKNVWPGDIIYIEKIRSVADCLQYQGSGAEAFKITVR